MYVSQLTVGLGLLNFPSEKFRPKKTPKKLKTAILFPARHPPKGDVQYACIWRQQLRVLCAQMLMKYGTRILEKCITLAYMFYVTLYYIILYLL